MFAVMVRLFNQNNQIQTYDECANIFINVDLILSSQNAEPRNSLKEELYYKLHTKTTQNNRIN